jgi:hypothetical protein
MEFNQIKSLLQEQIKLEIKNLILYINKLYPKHFTKKDANKMITKYTNNITFSNYENDFKKKTNMEIKKAIFNRKFRNSFIIKTNNINFNSQLCHARTWNNGSIIKKEDGSLVYGKQCSRGICQGSKKYCKYHMKNNPHNDFNEPPSIKLQEHYKKEGSFDKIEF